MKSSVVSAKLVRYNANTRGNSVGDCVKRSMSFAFDISYNDISKLLIAAMKQLHVDAWNITPVINKVMKELGATWHRLDVDKTLEEYVDEDLPQTGSFVVLVSDKKGAPSNHAVAVVDGVIYDSWDCRKRYPATLYTIPDKVRKPITDISDHMRELGEYAAQVTEDEITRVMAKRAQKNAVWEDASAYCTQGKTKNFSITLSYKVYFPKTEQIRVTRTYSFDIVYALTPSTTIEEAHEMIEKIAKVRVYDRLAAVDGKEANFEEEYEMKKKIAEAGRDTGDEMIFWDGRSRRFYDSLPGWAKGIVTYVNVQNPGQYSDSYSIKIRKLPDDTSHNRDYFWLEGYQSYQILEQLQRYKETHEVAGYDYDYDY